MMRIENHCVDCDIPCNPNCNLTHVEVFYCDCCGEAISERGYHFDGEDYCEWCTIAAMIDKHYPTKEKKIRFYKESPIDDEEFMEQLEDRTNAELFDEMIREDIEVLAQACGERLEAIE